MKFYRYLATGVLAALMALCFLSPAIAGEDEIRPSASSPAGINYAASHYDSGTRNSPVAWDDIDQDFQILASHFDIVRTYSMGLWNSLRVPRAAQRYGLRMVIGVGWAYNATADNKLQLELFKYIFGTYPELQSVVDYVIVGNEACVAGNQAAWADWIAFYNEINTWVTNNWQGTKPVVTISERDGVWEATSTQQCGGYLKANLPTGVPIFANIYPFWADITVDEAIKGANSESLDQKWERLTSAVTTRGIIIGETGWPTGGSPGTNPVTVTPAEADSATYWKYIYQTFLPANSNVTMFAFSAFDEPLKPSEGGSPDLAHHWGMYSDVRAAKPGMTFPKTTTVAPQAAKGANVNVVLAGPVYTPVKSQITITQGTKTYTYAQWFSAPDGSAGYPWLEYNSLVTLNLPASAQYSAAKCSNTLTGGHGIGPVGLKKNYGSPNLQWSGSPNHNDPCSMINWAQNGIWLP